MRVARGDHATDEVLRRSKSVLANQSTASPPQEMTNN
jgi:hypothetical protein